ncbi:hypothetical protein DACRYDRAFT_55466 [Dacryopinax primogenitus]|uniref:Uncharacterized protein n=1 Tax=Dacryopinax primogenitus (strain DJM 731) TaxID=1858805 RepID=M5G701_DACPD|nr:uncharacterized protein DACRYDRAFT_55466 [Dacryopinax primogenitus]EJT99537.1 hypothetical protein DACRYDRAFT_55466 [Dacryopinax primogenitus]
MLCPRSKYPLACLAKLMEVYGEGLAISYDISCEHSKTVACTEELRVHYLIGAFHGYTHNWHCQLGFHPWFLGTAGLEEFETNEHLFSRQNLTAHLFCYASAYH